MTEDGISLEIEGMTDDESREPDGVVPLPMCLAHRHTRGGGYPGRATNLEFVCLRA